MSVPACTIHLLASTPYGPSCNPSPAPHKGALWAPLWGAGQQARATMNDCIEFPKPDYYTSVYYPFAALRAKYPDDDRTDAELYASWDEDEDE